MMSSTNQMQQMAKEYHIGSLIGTYKHPGFGKYLVAAGAVCLFVSILFALSEALSGVQGWLCLTLLATCPIFICILAFLARNWGVYEYDEGFIINQGRDVRVVVWDEIVSLERSTSITNAEGPTDNTVTYTVWLKHNPALMLTTDYRGISHLIATIEGKLAEAKPQVYPGLKLAYDNSLIFSAA